CYVIFVIQMQGVHLFSPNQETDPTFANALVQAAAQGVTVLAMDCTVTQDSMHINNPVPIKI
ncbi:MAG: DNA/RNA nuclease SfsA, partial [Clostridia bacterium]|nr:DNA/RNA nuclease SfsA [Clostridia bacterium]